MLYLGIMSGTSLDGVDLALCSFEERDGLSYKIHKAVTLPYPIDWEKRLRGAMSLSGLELIQLDRDLGVYLGQQVKKFLEDVQTDEPILVCSHGHTVFHAPGQGVTLQLGHGPSLREQAGYPVVWDFRSADVAAGGHGAPLVPVADRDLFGAYPICLNLGGFANITVKMDSTVSAFDICACNTVLNDLSNQLGQPYDAGGALARQGSLIPELLYELNGLPLYQAKQRPSLGREFVTGVLSPLLSNYTSESTLDLLHTYTHHCAWAIAGSVPPKQAQKALVTGGGAFNMYLVELLGQYQTTITWLVPDAETVSFKEALAFAYLGYLHVKGLPGNVLTVTHAAGPRVLGVFCP